MMKKMIPVSLALLCAAVTGSPAADVERTEAIQVMSDGTVPMEAVERIAAFAQLNLALPVEPGETSADAVSLKAAGLEADGLSKGGAPVIVLSSAGEPDATHTVFLYEENVAVVNVSAVSVGADKETLERRLERLVMRGVGFLLGQKPAIDPFSVMAPYATLKDLDQLGRNFSPPDLKTLQMTALERGLPLIEDSPFNLAP